MAVSAPWWFGKVSLTHSQTLHQLEVFVLEWLESVCRQTSAHVQCMCRVSYLTHSPLCARVCGLCVCICVCMCAFVAVCMVWLQRNHVEPILPIPLWDCEQSPDCLGKSIKGSCVCVFVYFRSLSFSLVCVCVCVCARVCGFCVLFHCNTVHSSEPLIIPSLLS